jgi:hypothetical protein
MAGSTNRTLVSEGCTEAVLEVDGTSKSKLSWREYMILRGGGAVEPVEVIFVREEEAVGSGTDNDVDERSSRVGALSIGEPTREIFVSDWTSALFLRNIGGMSFAKGDFRRSAFTSRWYASSRDV